MYDISKSCIHELTLATSNYKKETTDSL